MLSLLVRAAAAACLQVRVNTISAGPLGSRAAKAIGFIDDMIRYSYANAPIQKELAAKVRVFTWM
jgi:enoyl-[acyl-carrier-protein] reductase (NADH)